MLIRITNRCTMGCCHCLVDAQPDGEHMSWDTFTACMGFQLLLEQQGAPAVLMLSGGEPTEHPRLLDMLEYIDQLPMPVYGTKRAQMRMVFLLSNGEFTADLDQLEKILKHPVLIQVTNDPRFYPRGLPPANFQELQKRGMAGSLAVENQLRMLVRLGRAARPDFSPLVPGAELEWRRAPMCFNLRSATGYLRSLPQALAELGRRGYWCSPSINIDGSIVAGEAPGCTKIGDVTENPILVTSRLTTMTCNRCGLVNNLDHNERQAIGEAMIELLRGDL